MSDSAEAASGLGAADRPRPARKERGPNPLRRVMTFYRQVIAELRKVIWPTRRELLTYTAVVLVFVAFMLAIVAGFDFLFSQGVLAVFGDSGPPPPPGQ
jgi:preprotein translocase subunit SecE